MAGAIGPPAHPGTGTGAIRRAAALVISGLALTALAGWWGASASTGATSSPPTIHHIDLNRVRAYSSIAELTSDSDVIAKVTATSQHRVETIGQGAAGLDFTVTNVIPNRVLKGNVPPGSGLRVRQTGSATQVCDDCGPAFKPGGHYLLFLQRFTLTPGDSTGQYVIVGVAAGLYEVRDDSHIAKLDPVSPESLPAVTSLDEISRAIGS